MRVQLDIPAESFDENISIEAQGWLLAEQLEEKTRRQIFNETKEKVTDKTPVPFKEGVMKNGKIGKIFNRDDMEEWAKENVNFTGVFDPEKFTPPFHIPNPNKGGNPIYVPKEKWEELHEDWVKTYIDKKAPPQEKSS